MDESSDAVVGADIDDQDDAGGEPPSLDDRNATNRLDHIVESVLFATATPVSLRKLVEILDGPAAKEV